MPYHPAIAHVLQFFTYAHLSEHLQEISKEFCELARKTADRAPASQETTVALRKLLEAKSEHLQEISKDFCELARKTADRAPASQETMVALRKLLEAKDAAVRAALSP